MNCMIIIVAAKVTIADCPKMKPEDGAKVLMADRPLMQSDITNLSGCIGNLPCAPFTFYYPGIRARYEFAPGFDYNYGYDFGYGRPRRHRGR